MDVPQELPKSPRFNFSTNLEALGAPTTRTITNKQATLY